MTPGASSDQRRAGSVKGLAVLCLTGAAIVWLAIAAVSPGYVADIESRKARSKWVTEEGIENAYRMRIDYPPGNLYLFKAVGHLYQSTADSQYDRRQAAASQYLTFLLKLPPILFHFLTAFAVYAFSRRFGDRRALLAGGILLFDPAAIWNVAHQGQYDPVHTFFAIVAVLGLASGRLWLAGLAIGLAAATKPQAWILIPLVAAYAWRLGRWTGLFRSAAAAAAAVALVLAPFAVSGRLPHLLRLPEYMNTNSTANHVISANAHNLWWLPTLLAGRWVDDSELLLGMVEYRWVGAALVVAVLAVCLRSVLKETTMPQPALLAATLGAGWFFFTPRAHEYHAFFVLPFLALALAERISLLPIYILASLSLLANLVLHDPVALGSLASPPTPETLAPLWLVVAELANVSSFLALFVLLAARLKAPAVNLLAAAKPALADP